MITHTNACKYTPETYGAIKARLRKNGSKDWSKLGQEILKTKITLTSGVPMIHRPPSHIITLYQN